MPWESSCKELNKLHLEATGVIQEVRRIRRSRDLNFFEDADLNGLKHDSLTALIKHLLAGHGGEPCPAGSRPIVNKPALSKPFYRPFANNVAHPLDFLQFWNLRAKTRGMPSKPTVGLPIRP